ncbi:hypothetical protein ACH5RR_018141, partial [Cinchona calisaya]
NMFQGPRREANATILTLITMLMGKLFQWLWHIYMDIILHVLMIMHFEFLLLHHFLTF